MLLYIALPFEVSYTVNPKYSEMDSVLCSLNGAHGIYELLNRNEFGTMGVVVLCATIISLQDIMVF